CVLCFHSVLFRRHSCIRTSLHLHVCVPEEGPSSQQLALVREERCLGSVLQSCSDRHAASRRCGGVLFVHGFLPDFSEMTWIDLCLGHWTMESR
ncbi:hypothetical protein PO909_020917, partial [Leuciscus waleckii]